MTNGKRTKGKTMIYKTLHRKLKIEQQNTFENWGYELGCSERVSSYSFTSDTPVTNPVISHEYKKDCEQTEYIHCHL